MNRLDRALGILLLLRQRKVVTAQFLASHFEVALRTIYRDLDALAELGIPVYAEHGRNGGFRLLDGHFMPPIAFSFGEAMALVLAQSFQKGLRVRPFPADAASAEHKLLAAMPEPVRSRLQQAEQLLGVENLPADLLHPEFADPQLEAASPQARALEAQVLTRFLSAIVKRQRVQVEYRSPYHDQARRYTLEPRATFWDRDRWYLVGSAPDSDSNAPPRTLRADRVLGLHVLPTASTSPQLDVRELLGRRWLQPAMQDWAKQSPVRLQLTSDAALKLQTDWYFRFALFTPGADGHIVMSWGEDRQAVVFDLLRWLGESAELLEPKAWRDLFRAELMRLAQRYL